jgi:quercetin dioxygenase-like cupin family protein
MVKPIVRQAGEGDRYWFYGGGVHVWKVTDEQSGGALFAFEDELVKGKKTPLHLHSDATECIYVLDGEIRSQIDGEERLLGAGSFVMTPPGVPHALVVTSDTARVLSMQIPGSGAAFYLGASEPATAELEAEGPVDFDRVIASGVATGGMKVLGPPPF